MKKKLFLISSIAISCCKILAQEGNVGINTTTPAATLDVAGSPNNLSRLDGIIAPRITGVQLRAKIYTAAQDGAIIYVQAADSAPSGQTVDVKSAGYYYFNSTKGKWIKLDINAWYTNGNDDAEISSSPETLGNVPTSANYLGAKGATDDLVIVTGNNVHAVVSSTGALTGGNSAVSNSGGGASFSWGTNNMITGTPSSIAIGKDNTAAASNNNFISTAIGTGNIPTNGATAIGFRNGYSYVDGGAGDIAQSLSGVTSYAFGRYNYGQGISLGFFNNSNGGFTFGASLKASSNALAIGFPGSIGNIGEARGTGAMYIGTAGGLALNAVTVYSNARHIFTSNTDSSGNALAATSLVGINITPNIDKDGLTTGNPANKMDLYLNKGLNINVSTGNAAAPTNITVDSECNSNTEGNIIYWVNTSTNIGNFYGCRRNGSTTIFIWSQL